jgi:hypothetical protein
MNKKTLETLKKLRDFLKENDVTIALKEEGRELCYSEDYRVSLIVYDGEDTWEDIDLGVDIVHQRVNEIIKGR